MIFSAALMGGIHGKAFAGKKDLSAVQTRSGYAKDLWDNSVPSADSKNPSDSSISSDKENTGVAAVRALAEKRAKEKAESLRQYIHQQKSLYNQEYCILVDMSVHSGINRLFVYNLKTDSIEMSSLVSHGIGSNPKTPDGELRFSNEPSSLQTSLGRYKIGASYHGQYGRSFRLYGLDNSNSNAYSRSIVLHSHQQIPVQETYPLHIGESFGCPIVSPVILDKLGNYIMHADKPILLWIYNQ